MGDTGHWTHRHMFVAFVVDVAIVGGGDNDNKLPDIFIHQTIFGTTCTLLTNGD